MNDEELIEIYSEFRKNIQEVSLPPAKYNLFKINSQDVNNMIYDMFLEDHSRQIANDTNLLRRCIVKLQAWKATIIDMNEQKKLDIIVEFIEPLYITAISLPNAIKDRFTYSLTHLCHQANRYKINNWQDNLPEEYYIKTRTMNEKCKHWKLYTNFEESHSQISDEKYMKNIYNARNMFHHRIPIGIEIGISNMIKRTKEDDGRISYSFGGIQPLSLENIITALIEQYDCIMNCFEMYQKLIKTQKEFIDEYKNE